MKAQTPKYFNKKLSIGIFLLPLSVIYRFVSVMKKWFSFSYKSKAKVICIGNITLGGVGKTPLVIKIIEELIKKNFKVGLLSRGYGGKLSSSKPVLVNEKFHTAIDVGDEVFMIYKKFKKKIPVCICSNRASGAKILEDKVDIIIMDDGFQNYTLKKDKSILVFDGIQGIGNGFIFPAGPLRENIKSIKKSDAIVVIRNFNQKLKKSISKFEKPIFTANTFAKNLKNFSKKQVVAFAGIGNPQKFYDTLREEKVKIKKSFEFPDHYQYTNQDFEKILKISKNLPILTTTKDFIKIPQKYQNKIIPIEIDLKIENKNSLIDIVLK